MKNSFCFRSLILTFNSQIFQKCMFLYFVFPTMNRHWRIGKESLKVLRPWVQCLYYRKVMDVYGLHWLLDCWTQSKIFNNDYGVSSVHIVVKFYSYVSHWLFFLDLSYYIIRSVYNIAVKFSDLCYPTFEGGWYLQWCDRNKISCKSGNSSKSFSPVLLYTE